MNQAQAKRRARDILCGGINQSVDDWIGSLDDAELADLEEPGGVTMAEFDVLIRRDAARMLRLIGLAS